MIEKSDEKEILKILRREAESIYDIFESDTFITTIYLLKYLDDGEIKYYNLFLEKMNKLSLEEKRQVFLNVISNLKNREQNVVKTKKKVKHENK